MTKDCFFCDVAIVGGGVLGTMVAADSHKIGKRLKTVCFRLSDSCRPRAESLRNQGWLQSGLRYVKILKKGDPEYDPKMSTLPQRMWTAGRRLQSEFSVRPVDPDVKGLVQMPLAECEQFLENARVFGEPVTQLAGNEARKLLGRFWDSGGACFEVPEQHLNFAEVMHQARNIATSQNDVLFLEVADIKIIRPSDTSSIRLLVDGSEVEARVIIFAAGCGNVRFMDDLTLDHQYKIRQTPLVVVKGQPEIERPVFYDRINKLSVVAHNRRERTSEGCMIIGTRTTSPIEAFCDAGQRYVEPPHVKEILDNLDRPLQLRKPPRRYRFTAGWEPIPRNGKDVEPQVFDISEHGHGNVIFAFCGRATFVLSASEQVTKLAKNILNKTRAKGSASRSKKAKDPNGDGRDIGKPWVDDIYMHHEDCFTFSDDEDIHKRKRARS